MFKFTMIKSYYKCMILLLNKFHLIKNEIRKCCIINLKPERLVLILGKYMSLSKISFRRKQFEFFFSIFI